MIDHAYERVASGVLVPGLIATTNDQPIGAAIQEILLIVHCYTSEEMRDRVIFLPLH
jgi:hypothetical protein